LEEASSRWQQYRRGKVEGPPNWVASKDSRNLGEAGSRFRRQRGKVVLTLSLFFQDQLIVGPLEFRALDGRIVNQEIVFLTRREN
jgi:hypothetical protein